MGLRTISFSVLGKPQPRGSKTSFPLVNKATGEPRRGSGGRIITVTKDSNPNSGEWMQAVAQQAGYAMQSANISEVFQGPLLLACTFYVLRPKGHFNSKGAVKASAPAYPDKKPDASKLLRGVEDAMTGVVYRDDAQIVVQSVAKEFRATAGVVVTIGELEETVAAQEEIAASQG